MRKAIPEVAVKELFLDFLTLFHKFRFMLIPNSPLLLLLFDLADFFTS